MEANWKILVMAVTVIAIFSSLSHTLSLSPLASSVRVVERSRFYGAPVGSFLDLRAGDLFAFRDQRPSWLCGFGLVWRKIKEAACLARTIPGSEYRLTVLDNGAR